MKRCLIFLVLFIVSNLTAQEKINIPETLQNKPEVMDDKSFQVEDRGSDKLSSMINSLNSYEDILSYRLRNPDWTNVPSFRFDPGDVIVQWYEAPADLRIESIGFWLNGYLTDSSLVEVKIVKCNWDKEYINSFSSSQELGYYPADGLDIPRTPFLDDEERTGEWYSETGYDSPFGEFVWEGESEIPHDEIAFGEYTWVNLDSTQTATEFRKGELFALAIKNISHVDTASLYINSSFNTNVAGFKYYHFGRSTDSGITYIPGWFIRTEYNFDLAAKISYIGDTPPIIRDVTELETTYSTDPREVQATIIKKDSGIDTELESAILKYTLQDESIVNEVSMNKTGENLYSAFIPGIRRGLTLSYWIEATDRNSNMAISDTTTYDIYIPTGKRVLVVFNGKEHYGNFNKNDYLPWLLWDRVDTWSYGELTEELLLNYRHVLEFCIGDGPRHDNRDVIRNWLSMSEWNSYLISGENWLGHFDGQVDMVYQEGSFEYDILGIKRSFLNVDDDGLDGKYEPTLVFPLENSLLGGELYDTFTASEYDSMLHNSWNSEGEIDAMELIETAETDIMIQTHRLEGEYLVKNLPATIHHLTDNNNKVAVSTLDFASLYSIIDENWIDMWAIIDIYSMPQVEFYFWVTSIADCYDRDLDIKNVTDIPSTQNPENFTVYADVYSGTTCGTTLSEVDTVNLMYSINSADYITAPMQMLKTGLYKSNIYNISSGSDVTYYINVKDEFGYSEASEQHSFVYFKKQANNTLVIINGGEKVYSRDISSQFTVGSNMVEFDQDRWGLFELTPERAENYNTIFEIYTDDAADSTFVDNRQVVKDWLLEDNNRNYFIGGEDWLGKFTNENSGEFPDTSFEKSILGLNSFSKNIYQTDSPSSYRDYLYMYPEEGTLAGPYYSEKGVDSIRINTSLQSEFHGFNIGGDKQDDIEARGITGELFSVAGHRELENGNKVAYMTFNQDSLRYQSGAEWIEKDYTSIASFYAEWFGLISDVKNITDEELPSSYSLSQNYPNPFNPATMIEYSIPVVDENFSSTTTTNVKLIIYDILGREVATLVNERQKPGKYSVDFGLNGYNRSFPSGVYFYRITAGRFSETKKMMILK